MCLAVPVKIVEIDGTNAVVETGGVRRKANLAFVPDATVGDFVLLHAGFAIKKWSEEDVQELNQILAGVDALEGEKSS
jgi:hydrogenase expression/formation protein HypC